MTPQEPMLSSFAPQQRQQRHSFDSNEPDSKHMSRNLRE